MHILESQLTKYDINKYYTKIENFRNNKYRKTILKSATFCTTLDTRTLSILWHIPKEGR